MTKFTGEVEKVFEKQINTRRGKRPVYSLKINTDEAWFDCGFDKPNVEEGDYVQFEAEKNEKGYYKVDKGAVVKIERPKSASSSAGGGTGGSSGSFAADKELRYNYRFALGIAQEFALACLEKGFLPTVSAQKTKAQKAATLEDLDQFIEERSAKIFARCMNVEELETILDSVDPVEAEDVAPGPDSSDDTGSED